MNSTELDYTNQRQTNPVLEFRYKSRALIVAETIKKYHTHPSNLNILDLGAADGLTATELNQLLPNNKIIGARVMRRKLKISGLKTLGWSVPPPAISINPTTIIANPIAINL